MEVDHESTRFKSVYAGQWKPEGLSQTFNIYADTRDLGVPKTFNDTRRYLANLKNRDGHDGFNHDVEGLSPEGALLEAFRTGAYKGEWFIPPLDVLKKNLYGNKPALEENGAFKTKNGLFYFAHWYWSCTEPRDDPSVVWNVSFSVGVDFWLSKDDYALSSRPVRAEPAAP